MSMEAKFCVLSASGINCDNESARLVREAGGEAEMVHVTQLESGERMLRSYQGLFLPGGFSDGDAGRAGITLATRLREGLGDDIRTFAEAGKPVLGVCNGFQVLVNLGMLPGEGKTWEQTASLTKNVSGKFESRTAGLRVNKGARSPFVPPELDPLIELPIANGEGSFVASEERLAALLRNGQVLLRYAREDGWPSMDPVYNPSGARYAIAAISNKAGNVMGSMPHIERDPLNHQSPGHIIMGSIVRFAASL